MNLPIIILTTSLSNAKSNIEEVIKLLTQLKKTEPIKQNLVAVHNQLEGLHDLKRHAIKCKKISFQVDLSL